MFLGFPGSSDGKESTCNGGDLGPIPGVERSHEGGHGNPLQYSCLGNSHRKRGLAGCSPWGHRVGHNWAIKYSQKVFTRVSVGNTQDSEHPHLELSQENSWLFTTGGYYQLSISEVTKVDEIAQRISSLRNELRTEVSGHLLLEDKSIRSLHGKGIGSKLALWQTTGKEEKSWVWPEVSSWKKTDMLWGYWGKGRAPADPVTGETAGKGQTWKTCGLQ